MTAGQQIAAVLVLVFFVGLIALGLVKGRHDD